MPAKHLTIQLKYWWGDIVRLVLKKSRRMMVTGIKLDSVNEVFYRCSYIDGDGHTIIGEYMEYELTGKDNDNTVGFLKEEAEG